MFGWWLALVNGGLMLATGRRERVVQRLLQVVLTAWREADRVAAERPEGAREHEAALVAADRLRGLYTDLVASAEADNDVAALKGVLPPDALDPASN